MAQHPNVELLRKALDAFSRGDLDTVRSLWADDIVYHFSGASPLAGDYKGKDGVLSYFAKAVELAGGTLRMVEVHDVLANDEHAVALLRATGSRKGKQYEAREVDVFHFKDGRIIEFWSFSEDQRMTDEFWS